MTPDEPWLLPFLRRMSVRPGAYLGSESVFALELFITAYALARSDLGIAEFGREEESLMTDFGLWLESRLKMSDTRGWPGLIEKADPSSKNVHTFVRLFDEFLRQSVGIAHGLTSDEVPRDR